MQLRITVDGATKEEVRRGLNAALDVFEKAKMDPLTAAEGMFALEGWDIQGFPDDGLSAEDSKAADVWMDAEQAAIDACCADWPDDRERPSAVLELIEQADDV